MGSTSPIDWTDCEAVEIALEPIVCYACACVVEFDPWAMTLSWSWVEDVRWVCSRDCQKAVIAQAAIEGLVHDPDPGDFPEADNVVSVQRASDYRRPDYD